jgi:thiol:disulfide interchange protein/DsbC/DsbD-like thiol-disulfide interchange protein
LRCPARHILLLTMPFATSRPLTTVLRRRAWRVMRGATTGAMSLLALVANAQTPRAAPRDPSPHSDATLISDVSSVRPGEHVTVAVRLTLDPGWHTYWINPGDAGLPLKVKWTLPAGVTAGALQFPTPHLTPQAPLMSYGYEDEVFVLTELQVPANAVVGSSLHVTGKAEWLACAEVCLPATGPLSLDIPVAAGVATPTQFATALTNARAQLPAPSTEWTARAWATKAGYTLALVRNTPQRTTQFVAPYFFVDSADVLEHADPQQVIQLPDTLVLSLPRSKVASGTAHALSGIMLLDIDGAPPRGLHVSAPVSDNVPGALRTRATAMLQRAGPIGGVPLTATFGPGTSSNSTTSFTADMPADLSLLTAILFAFLGGLILNLMPCVFPVLSVKVLALLEHGGATDPSRGRKHGLAFGVGVLLSFWILAGVLISLRAGGQSLGWGFQLQSPPVVAILALLMFALGLNLSGVFEIGLSLTRLGAAGSGGSYRDSMLTGALAVLVAAPCTAPFMGAALGYALVQPALISLGVFTALAIGLALPFVVLASAPQLLRFLPRPGQWLETLKQLFAFPLYVTVVWLLWVFGLQAGIDSLANLLIAMIVLSLGAWLWARGVRMDRPVTKLSAGLLFVAAAALGIAAGNDTSSAMSPAARTMPATTGLTGSWEPFSTERVNELRAAGRPIFIDFTAAWCLSCQVNERVALRTDRVQQAFRAANVALLRADWTSRDSAITNVLATFGRSGVPLYVLYPADRNAPPVILPAVLTPGIVVSAVATAAPTSVLSAVR